MCVRHYLGEPDDAALQTKIANYLRRVRAPMVAGHWCTTVDFDMRPASSRIFALKMTAIPADAPHMRVRARHPVARWRRPQQRLYPVHAGDVRC